MTVQEFLARQKSEFILVRDLLDQMVAASDCSLQDAAKALASHLARAGTGAPAWHTLNEFTGPALVTTNDCLNAANFMLEELACDRSRRLYDPRVTFEHVMTEELDDEEYRSIYILVWQAYRECGFLAKEIYSLLRNGESKIPLPEADAILGPVVSTTEPPLSASASLGPQDSRDAYDDLMARGPGLQTKDRIVRLLRAGVSKKKIAGLCQVSPSYAYRVMRAEEATDPNRLFNPRTRRGSK